MLNLWTLLKSWEANFCHLHLVAILWNYAVASSFPSEFAESRHANAKSSSCVGWEALKLEGVLIVCGPPMKSTRSYIMYIIGKKKHQNMNTKRMRFSYMFPPKNDIPRV